MKTKFKHGDRVKVNKEGFYAGKEGTIIDCREVIYEVEYQVDLIMERHWLWSFYVRLEKKWIPEKHLVKA